MRIETQVLVVGSGVAGLSYALKAAEHAPVTLLTKRGISDTATSWAQGGISAVFDPEDSFEAHIEDTLEAGAGLCHAEVVRLCVEQGPERIRELLELGARFTRSRSGAQDLDLGREGGHSHRRVVHAADMTGREVQRVLVESVRRHERIRVEEGKVVIDLITPRRLGIGASTRVVGAYVLDRRRGQVDTYLARVVVLATGGAGKVYLYTSNPDTSTGDGVAMAYRAGAKIANMEFFQFHPTCLYHPKAKSFLISEALRGEGAVLKLLDGTEFMDRYHPQRSLAPRDVVARAIDAEMKRTGDDHVLLDITFADREFLLERFPAIYARCKEYGIDIATEAIPVVPAAHYLCGGVLTDSFGQSSLPGLFVIGEAACTGLHGANRLASNSLLEGLVFAHRAAEATPAALEAAGDPATQRVPEWNPGEAGAPDEQVVVSHNWDEIRRLMWNYVGIVRTTKRLERARRRLRLLREEIREYYWAFHVTPDVVELRNIETVARLIVESALRREESRGLHYTLDFPERDDAHFARDTILERSALEPEAASTARPPG
ncbi:MAG: L-aspartate oxidase [Deltaproteobacteria bacterium]|nr:MAG: L-aspartate oxidase [Deltaproteobacteria bacterium]